MIAVEHRCEISDRKNMDGETAEDLYGCKVGTLVVIYGFCRDRNGEPSVVTMSEDGRRFVLVPLWMVDP